MIIVDYIIIQLLLLII